MIKIMWMGNQSTNKTVKFLLRVENRWKILTKNKNKNNGKEKLKQSLKTFNAFKDVIDITKLYGHLIKEKH